MITYTSDPRPDRLARADSNLWRGPCGGWHYKDRTCQACVELARLEQER